MANPTQDSSPHLAAIRGVITVQNYGISGSTFVQSLLDDHPQILSLPGLYAHPLYPFFDEKGHLPFEEFMQAFFERFQFWFDPSLALTHVSAVTLGLHQMGPNRDQPLAIDMMSFLETFEEHYRPYLALSQPLRRKYFIIAVFLAYYAGRGKSVPANHSVWILYPIHSLQFKYAQYMREDFADYRFIHSVREPLRNIGSTIRFTLSHADWWVFDALQRGLAQILNDYQLFAEIIRVNGYRPYFDVAEVPAVAVKLEDLHAHPKAMMTALARWLGIDWNDSLLQSSFSGMTWWNRPESKRVSGFDKEIPNHDFLEFVTARDRYILAPLLRRQYRAWGYATPASRLRLALHLPWLFVPLSREKPEDIAKKRYEAWLTQRKITASTAHWHRWRLGEYYKCRRWLFMAWWASLIDNETIIKPLDTA